MYMQALCFCSHLEQSMCVHIMTTSIQHAIYGWAILTSVKYPNTLFKLLISQNT